jgi:hypothetical protein
LVGSVVQKISCIYYLGDQSKRKVLLPKLQLKRKVKIMSNYKSTEMGFNNVGIAVEKAIAEKALASENISIAGAEDVAKAEQVNPGAEAATAEAPGAEAPAAEAPKADTPTAEAPAAEPPKTEEKTEEQKKAEEAAAKKAEEEAIIAKGGFTAEQLEAIRTAARQEAEAYNKAIVEDSKSFPWKTAAWIGGGIIAGVAAAFAVAALCGDDDAE